MLIKKIQLENFRRLNNCDYQFKDGINIILGENGVGKTTLIEAIGLLSEGKSFRTKTDSEMISTDMNCALVSARTVSKDLSHLIKILIVTEGKKAQVDGNIVKKMSRLIGTFVAVSFIPADIYLFIEPPRVRRRFIDAEISKISPIYLDESIRYQKILHEKSLYLKYQEISTDLLQIYNQQLAQASILIARKRREFLDKLEHHLNQIFPVISGKPGYLSFRYHSIVNDSDGIEEMMTKYQEWMEKEILKRSIMIGVHQDDIELNYHYQDEIHPIQSYFSQGETRLAVLALKLALASYMEKEISEKVVLLLDDVLSEIDSERKNYLMEYLKKKGQVFITAVSLSEINQNIIDQINVINI